MTKRELAQALLISAVSSPGTVIPRDAMALVAERICDVADALHAEIDKRREAEHQADVDGEGIITWV